MAENGRVLITAEDIRERIAEIDRRQADIYEREYRYGYMPYKMEVARLYQEKKSLMNVLAVLEGYSLEDIQKELDSRDPEQKGNWRAEGLAKYSFEVLGHAEKVLQHADGELQARVDLGEKVIENWEKIFKSLSWDEDKAVYGLIRDKDLPYERLEESIRKCLIRMNDSLMESVCDIGGRKCLKIDEWRDGEDTFVLGNFVSEGEFYYAEVNGSICNTFEYDFRPSREQVEDDWMNREAERALDEHEARIGGFDFGREDYQGNSDYYKFFYAGDGQQDEEAHAFQKETGWHMIWGSDYEGLNGDTWVVFRSVEDLPKWLRDYAATAHDVALVQVGSGEIVYEAPETPVIDDLIADARDRLEIGEEKADVLELNF